MHIFLLRAVHLLSRVRLSAYRMKKHEIHDIGISSYFFTSIDKAGISFDDLLISSDTTSSNKSDKIDILPFSHRCLEWDNSSYLVHACECILHF
jgi:hypothetical protein